MATELRQNAVHFFILLLLLLFLLLTVRSTAYCMISYVHCTVQLTVQLTVSTVPYGTVRSQYHTYHIIIPGYRGVSYVRMIVLTYTV